MSDNQPPGELIIGKQNGCWPVLAFVTESHAAAWLVQDRNDRRAWRVKVTDPVELALTEPQEPRLVPKEAP